MWEKHPHLEQKKPIAIRPKWGIYGRNTHTQNKKETKVA